MEETSKEKNTGMAVLAYILFFLPLLTEEKKDPFVKYHVKQGLILFLAGMATRIIIAVPYIGWFLVWPFNVVLLILLALGIMNALNGKQEPLPIIGQFAKKFNF